MEDFKIYGYDIQGYYTNTLVTNKYKGMPSRYTKIEIPLITEDKFLKFDGNQWIVVGEKIYPSKVPQTITPLQAKLQLLNMGLLDEIDAMVATDRKIQLYWEYALIIERNNSILLTMSEQLGLTSEQLDDIFIQASKL